MILIYIIGSIWVVRINPLELYTKNNNLLQSGLSNFGNRDIRIKEYTNNTNKDPFPRKCVRIANHPD